MYFFLLTAISHFINVRYIIANHFVIVNLFYQNGRTPLMTAAISGKTEILKMLLEAKADANTQDKVNNAAHVCMM